MKSGVFGIQGNRIWFIATRTTVFLTVLVILGFQKSTNTGGLAISRTVWKTVLRGIFNPHAIALVRHISGWHLP